MLVGTRALRGPGATGLLVLVAVAMLTLLVAAPGVSAAGSGSVHFEVVDSATGLPLQARVLDVIIGDPGWVRAEYSDLSTSITGIAAGEHTFFAVHDFYGDDDSGRIDGGNNVRGEMVTATIVADAETLVRIEMTPPASVRFRAVSEVDGSVVSPLSVSVSPWTYGGSTSTGVVDEGDGWYTASIYPAPFEAGVSLTGSSSTSHHDIPPVASGSTLTIPDPLTVTERPTVSGRVVDPKGSPVAGAAVRIASWINGLDLTTHLTDDDGRFFIQRLSAIGVIGAFPPSTRTDLAAGGHAGSGLGGGWWPEDDRHVELEIVLPYGRWYPAEGARIAPTADRPVSGYIPYGADGAGINIVDGAGEATSGWTTAGPMIEVWNHDGLVVLDLHSSLRPTSTKIPTLAPLGGDAITCTLDVDCPLFRSRGPKGDQLVLGVNSTLESFSLLYGSGDEALFLDPPLVTGRAFGNFSDGVAISTTDGCGADLSITSGDLGVGSAPSLVPGTLTVEAEGIWGTQIAVGLAAGGANAVIGIDARTPELWSTVVDDNSFGGLLPADCTPPTTTTTTTTTTTAATTTTTSTSSTTTTSTVPTATTSTSTTLTTTTSTTSTSSMTSTSSTTTTTLPSDDPGEGYAVVTRAGDVYTFGDTIHLGDQAMTEATAIVLHPVDDGYWVVDTSGVVHGFGAAPHLGNIDPTWLGLGETITTMAATPDGEGYWIISDTGRVAAFGSAELFGDLSDFVLDGQIIDAAATPSGLGYYMVGSDGGLFSFGDARFRGSVPQVLPGVTLDAPVVGMTPDPDGIGYWFVAADGGVFGFDAPFRGSIPGVLPLGESLVASIDGMVPYGNGYLLVAGDGGVFTFSDLPFLGSLGDTELTDPIVAISAR
ncbi:MAG: carboxypeptidase regulatory-like domain-containing protein [Actinomycetia bacterium]|nr:carboxypeptidase regulatory-like domain-containing protein [Actinomycetes bacterium]